MTEPYYADELVTLFLGDCREVTEWLAADVLVTDRRCGAAVQSNGRMKNGARRCSQHRYSRPLTGIEVRLVNHPAMPVPCGEAVTDLAAGTAAEHLVCADLLLSGWRAFLADQNCPYDVAVDVGGRLVRIQVKSTRQQRAIPQRGYHTPAYQWHVRRAGKAGRRTYAYGDFDLLALVALDIRLIAYMPPSEQRQTVHIRLPGSSSGKQFADYPFGRATAEVLAG